jgi:hypothetical protein
MAVSIGIIRRLILADQRHRAHDLAGLTVAAWTTSCFRHAAWTASDALPAPPQSS